MGAVVCPVCNGRGHVSYGFYSTTRTDGVWATSHTGTEECRSCNGSGYVNPHLAKSVR